MRHLDASQDARAVIDLDATDRAILELLQGNGRMTNADLATAVHLSPSAVHRRVRRLEDGGVIDKYVMLVDPAAIGRPTSVFVEMTLSSQHEDVLDRFEEQVVQIPEVMSCHLMAGTADYLVHVVCADVADYERIHRSHLAQLPGLAQLHSSFSIRTVTERTAYSLA
jgi:Lrp/AsnC family leucine-responsive transcriptional regulator